MYPNPRQMDNLDVDKNLELGERIRRFIESTGLTINEFSKKVGVPHNSIGGYINNNVEPKHSFFKKIKSKFPTLNLTWLIVGTGKMIDETVELKEIVNTLQEKIYVVEEKAELYKRIIHEKDKNEALQKGSEPS